MKRWLTPGCAAVSIAFILAAAALVWRAIDVFGPSPAPPAVVTLTNALGELQAQGGLLAGWREIDTHIECDDPTIIGAFGYSIQVGTKHIWLAVSGNRVQYIIPADGRWKASEVDGVIVITAPPPIVNEKIVEVQSDPSKIRAMIDNDWGGHFTGDAKAVDKLKGTIRANVLAVASSEAALGGVRESARKTVAEFCRNVLSAASERPVNVRVVFADEDARERADELPK